VILHRGVHNEPQPIALDFPAFRKLAEVPLAVKDNGRRNGGGNSAARSDTGGWTIRCTDSRYFASINSPGDPTRGSARAS